MKDQINRILTKQIHTFCTGNCHSVQGVIPASEELQQLMCYREVKAIIQGRETAQLHNNAHFLIHGILKFDYPAAVIDKAIEQYKSEYQ